MKLFYLFVCIELLGSCTFNKIFVCRKGNKFEEVSKYLILNKNTGESLSADDATLDPKIRRKLKNLRVDGLRVGNKGLNDWEPHDSVVQFWNNGSLFLIRSKSVLYDYSKSPKVYSDTIVKGYRTKWLVRINNRLYLTKVSMGDL